MRALAGFLFFHLLLTAAGLGLLRALGLARWSLRGTVAVIGPAFLAGLALVVPLAIAGLVVGVPFDLWTTTAIGLTCAASGIAFAHRRDSRASAEPDATLAYETAANRVAACPTKWAVGLIAGAYAAFGAFALSRVTTQMDDARIWSLKGLFLFYYDSLKPGIFNNGFMFRAHPLYPLLQPVLEAIMFRSMGRPELRLFHTELWVVCAASVWTLAHVLSRTRRSPLVTLVCMAPVALLVVSLEPLTNVADGFADMTGSMILAAGALALSVWIEARGGCLAGPSLGTARRRGAHQGRGPHRGCSRARSSGNRIAGSAPVGRLQRFAVGTSVTTVLTLPWPIWTAIHHLKDSVTPPLPRAFSPGFLLHHQPELHESCLR